MLPSVGNGWKWPEWKPWPLEFTSDSLRVIFLFFLNSEEGQTFMYMEQILPCGYVTLRVLLSDWILLISHWCKLHFDTSWDAMLCMVCHERRPGWLLLSSAFQKCQTKLQCSIVVIKQGIYLWIFEPWNNLWKAALNYEEIKFIMEPLKHIYMSFISL